MADSFNFKLPVEVIEFLKQEDALDAYISGSDYKHTYKNHRQNSVYNQLRLNLQNDNVVNSLVNVQYKYKFYINSIFDWMDSLNGLDYWCDLYLKFEDSEFDKLIKL